MTHIIPALILACRIGAPHPPPSTNRGEGGAGRGCKPFAIKIYDRIHPDESAANLDIATPEDILSLARQSQPLERSIP